MASFHDCLLHTQEQAPISAYFVNSEMAGPEADLFFFFKHYLLSLFTNGKTYFIYTSSQRTKLNTQLINNWERTLKPNPSDDHS